jgi:hypothetical protein
LEGFRQEAVFYDRLIELEDEPELEPLKEALPKGLSL